MSNFVNLLDIIYPVGSIYFSTSSISPASSIGGTWTKIENCLLAASGDTYNVAGRFSGSNMISSLAIPDHQHNVVGWNGKLQQYSGIGFWNTNAAGGGLWQLLSVGTQDGGDTGWNLWTKGTWKIDDNGDSVTEQREHIPYHYSLAVYKRTA